MLDKIKNCLNKITKSKYWSAIVIVVIIVLLLIVYLLVNYTQTDVEPTIAPTTSITQELQDRLTTILKDIEGVGEVSVMISYAGSSETVYQNVPSDSLFENAEMVAVKENLPEILGVVVVAEGAEVIKTKINIVNAVMTALSISADKIQVFAK